MVARPCRSVRLFAGCMLVGAALPLAANAGDCAETEYCPGVDLNGGYTADFRRNTTGGLTRGNAVSGLLKAGVAWRSGHLVPGAFVTTSASVIHVAGDAISADRVGDLQGLNNIEAAGTCTTCGPK